MDFKTYTHWPIVGAAALVAALAIASLFTGGI
jgi:hypothetical protein